MLILCNNKKKINLILLIVLIITNIKREEIFNSYTFQISNTEFPKRNDFAPGKFCSVE